MSRLQLLKILFMCFVTVLSCFFSFSDLNTSLFCEERPLLSAVYIQFCLTLVLKFFVLFNFVVQISHYWRLHFICINFMCYLSTGSLLSLSYSINPLNCKWFGFWISISKSKQFGYSMMIPTIIIMLILACVYLFWCILNALLRR